ncbi:hypothetical protein LUZ60_010808 [Juncus effusus]|nr:hypothetical protein LUZ60_010808 [Juncus effusus]
MADLAFYSVRKSGAQNEGKHKPIFLTSLHFWAFSLSLLVLSPFFCFLTESLVIFRQSVSSFHIQGRIERKRKGEEAEMERMDEMERKSILEASKEVSLQFKSLVDSNDVNSIKHTQHVILGRLQDSNAVLSHFNEYSEKCFDELSPEFMRKMRLIQSVKSDLDHIFTKLRSMKSKLKATYPDAFPEKSEMLDQRPDLERLVTE